MLMEKQIKMIKYILIVTDFIAEKTFKIIIKFNVL